MPFTTKFQSLAIALIAATTLIQAVPLRDTLIVEDDTRISNMTTTKSLGWADPMPHRITYAHPYHHQLRHSDAPSITSTSTHDIVQELNAKFAASHSTDPAVNARTLAKRLLPADHQIQLTTRADSYLDPASGIYHAYLAQSVNGLDIEDGVLEAHLDSRGQILSFSSSLYTGEVPVPHTDLAFEGTAGRALRAAGQMVFGAPSQPPASASNVLDPRLALVGFLAKATPDASLASQFSSNPQAAASSIVSTLEQSKGTAGQQIQIERLDSVPGTTDSVTARLAYVQDTLKSGGKPILNLVWKFIVPMLHNHYETHVDATSYGQVSSVVDWVSRSERRLTLADLQAPSFARIDENDELKPTPVGAAGPLPTKNAKPLYKVYAWGLNDPTEGHRSLERGAREGDAASPWGWHTIPTDADPWATSSDSSGRIREGNATRFIDTRGNNVFASADLAGQGQWTSVKRPQGKVSFAQKSTEQGAEEESLLFDFPYSWHKSEDKGKILLPKEYTDASVTNLFVLANRFHDLTYAYGFDEVSGNFQESNNGRGGKGSDAVLTFAQDGAGMNNADFMTPPDGQRPRMRMYLWPNPPNSTRDGAFEEGIVIHEYTHGVSTRLVGGPANSGCLGWGEAGGMGEGWGDFFATTIRMRSEKDRSWTMGAWAAHSKGGIRKYPYSQNKTIDPETYESLDKPGMWGVHAIGEVWAEMLFEVLESMIHKHGWIQDLFPPVDSAAESAKDAFYRPSSSLRSERASKRRVPRHGNTLTLQLVVDAFKLTPCRPGFFEARDAVVAADKHLTGGENECEIWKAFAKRGLGMDAEVRGRTPWGGGVRTNGRAVPKHCKK